MTLSETKAYTHAATTVLDGNEAAAYAAKLCRVEVIAGYPITPQTPIMEYLAKLVASGELDATLVLPEGEHSVMSVVEGASMAGARTFTATSGQGLAYMYEPYYATSTMRLPVVMCLAMREMAMPWSGWASHQDAVSVRDAGWIQLYVETVQEVLDTVIMAYRIAEHPDVLLPVNVCYDGFYVSHYATGVHLPEQEEVDRFLPPYKADHVFLDPEAPVSVNIAAMPADMMRYRRSHAQAMAQARRVIQEVDGEFGRVFGRRYGGAVEGYRLEDAETALVTMAGMTGTARVAVDQARDRGASVGLLKVRSFRPFPFKEVREALRGKRAIGVIDRNLCFGWETGVLFVELSAALAGMTPFPRIIGFVAGLGGMEVTVADLLGAAGLVQRAAAGQEVPRVTWLGVEDQVR
ncbi:MAG: phenylglyoxylate dehydrogenase [Chloroflexota bacterium]